MDKVEFIKFGTKPRDNHTYALDSNGVIWANIEADIWESLEETPRRIKQALTADQLLQVVRQNKLKVV